MARASAVMLVTIMLLAMVLTAMAATTTSTGFRVFGEDDDFEGATSQGQWILLLNHRKHCAGGVCERADKAVLDAVELYKGDGEVFNLSRIDCWDYPDPCLDYGAKKRYPFLAINFHGLLKRGIQFKDEPSRATADSTDQSVSTASEIKEFIDGHIDQHTVRLDESNFDERISDGHWLVQFFAPYHKCKTSKNSWSGWSEVGEHGKRTKQFTAARVLCSKDFNQELCKRYVRLDVTDPDALPNIYWFEGNTTMQYEGLWGVKDIIKWWSDSVAEREEALMNPDAEEYAYDDDDVTEYDAEDDYATDLGIARSTAFIKAEERRDEL